MHLPPVLVEENFSKTKNKTAEKITGQRFPVKSKVTCKNSAHLDEEKKFGLNSHLRASCTQPFNYDVASGECGHIIQIERVSILMK